MRQMVTGPIHISVCICTYKRPELLKRLLDKLSVQDTGGLFSYSIVVADNDSAQSAKNTVEQFAAASSVLAKYCVETEKNIALARNKTLHNSTGEFIAFIDDDEFPEKDWLYNLFTTFKRFETAGVLGPVKPYFDHEPPRWVLKGGFFVRPEYETGYRLNGDQTRSGNVLFKRSILEGNDDAFNPEFGTGSEDVDFFSRMTDKGHVFVWCNEAVVYEVVPPSRCTRSYLLRRSLLRGSSFPSRSGNRRRNLAKSLVAVPVYTISLPIAVLFGHHMFIRYLIKLCDHASRILAFLGIKTVRERML